MQNSQLQTRIILPQTNATIPHPTNMSGFPRDLRSLHAFIDREQAAVSVNPNLRVSLLSQAVFLEGGSRAVDGLESLGDFKGLDYIAAQ